MNLLELKWGLAQIRRATVRIDSFASYPETEAFIMKEVKANRMTKELSHCGQYLNIRKLKPPKTEVI